MIALLVVDIQEEYFSDSFRQANDKQFIEENTGKYQKLFKNTDDFFNAVNEIIDKEEKAGNLIIYIREELPNTFFFRKVFGHSLKGEPGTLLNKKLKVVNDTQFNKMFGSAFSNKKFDRYLKSKSIDEVHIIGCDSVKCAYLTAKDALKSGYKVKMLSDALYSFTPSLAQKCEQELINMNAEYI